MRAVLALLALMPVAAQAGQQCVWPFLAPPPDVARHLNQAVKARIAPLCKGETDIAVRFRLNPGAVPSHVAVAAPTCPKAEGILRRWFADRPASEFMAYDQPQDVAFTIKTRFSAI
jgi:hypothetical protein